MAGATKKPGLLQVISRALEIVGGIAVLAILAYTVSNSLSRTIGGVPLPGTIELVSRWWMVAAIWCGIVLALIRAEHIRIDFAYNLQSPKAKRGLTRLSDAVVVLFMLSIAWGSWSGAWSNRLAGERGQDTGMPVWMTRFAVPMCALLFLVSLAAMRARSKGATAQDLEEGESSSE